MRRIKKIGLVAAVAVFATLIAVAGFCGCNTRKGGFGIAYAVDEALGRVAEMRQNEAAYADTVMYYLPESCVYDVSDGMLLIYYEGKSYYIDCKNNEITESDEEISYCETLAEALLAELSAGQVVYTLGYHEKFDGGCAGYTVAENSEGDISLPTENGLFLNYNSATDKVSIPQLGWKKGEYINEYQSRFENFKGLKTLILPSGEYPANDTIRTNRNDLSYFGIDATIYSADNFGGKGNTVYNVLWNVTTDWKHDRTIMNHTYSDIKFEMRTRTYNPDVEGLKKLERLFMLAYCDNVKVYNCKFIIPEGLHDDPKNQCAGCVDCFTDWHNVVFDGCVIENHSYVNYGSGIGFRDIYNNGCDNMTFTNNTVISSPRDEIVPLFAGVDKRNKPDAPLGKGYIRNVLLENNKFTALEQREGLDPRTMFLTVGYQLSPVYDIKYLNNTFDGYCNSYFLHFCYCKGLTFKGNDVNIRRSGDNSKMTLIRRADSPEASDIVVEDNVFNLLGDNFKLWAVTMTDFSDMSELTFRNNTVNMEGGKAETLIASEATVYGNVFNFKNVDSIYYRTDGTVYDNVYNIGTLSKSVYEFYNANVKHDLTVLGETINVDVMNCNLLQFNGSIKFNGHSLTFENVAFNIGAMEKNPYYLASNSDKITDTVVPITFRNCNLGPFEGHMNVHYGSMHTVKIE